MSFMFLTTRNTHDKKTLKKASEIAELNEATLVWVGKNGIPGNPLTGWFSSANLGSPFDEHRAGRVSEQLKAANIDW